MGEWERENSGVRREEQGVQEVESERKKEGWRGPRKKMHIREGRREGYSSQGREGTADEPG